MKLLKSWEARRVAVLEEKTERKIKQLSSTIGSALADKIHDEEVGPFPFDVGKKPKHISGEEYLGRINDGVMGALGRVSLKTEVIYDQKESRERNHEFVDLSGPMGQNWQQRVKDELVIVYRQASEQSLIHPSVLVE